MAALSLGAQAVSLGTRFLCSEESLAARAYKERVGQSTAEDTVYTTLFNGGWDAPHRVLRYKAGESCHLIHDIKPAAQIVRDMMHEAEEVIERLLRG